jgi:hypothetical protein
VNIAISIVGCWARALYSFISPLPKLGAETGTRLNSNLSRPCVLCPRKGNATKVVTGTGFSARCGCRGFTAWSRYDGPAHIDRTKGSKDRTRSGPAFFATFAIFECDQRVLAWAPSFQNHPPSTPKPSLLATAPIRCLARLIWSLEKPAAVPAFRNEGIATPVVRYLNVCNGSPSR